MYRPNGRQLYKDANYGNLTFYWDTSKQLFIYENGQSLTKAQMDLRTRGTNISSPSSSSQSGVGSSSRGNDSRYPIDSRGPSGLTTSHTLGQSIPIRNKVSPTPASDAAPAQAWARSALAPPYGTETATGVSGGSQEAYRSATAASGFSQQPYPSDFFKIGRVFVTVSEEHGDQLADDATYASGRTELHGEGSGQYISKRKYVVISSFEGYCRAVPLTTYNGRGVSKPGVTKSDHAIVYTEPPIPEPLPGEIPTRDEEGMRPNAIRIRRDDPTEKLQRTCRINFGVMFSIRHDAYVKSFGMVSDECIADLIYQSRSVVYGTGYTGQDTTETSTSTIRAPSSTRVTGPFTTYGSPPSGTGRGPVGILSPAPTNTIIQRGRTHEGTNMGKLPAKGSTTTSAAVAGSGGQTFPNFRSRNDPRAFFKVGRVFLTLFEDSQGGVDGSSQPERTPEITSNNQQVHVRTRRYVVVAEGKGERFFALSIHAYNGYGASGEGINKFEHGIVYTGERSKMLKTEQNRKGELPMRAKALQVIPDATGGTLEDAARINYGCPIPVPYDTKVKPFGSVRADHLGPLVSQWHEVGTIQKQLREESKEATDDEDEGEEEEGDGEN